MRSLAGILLTLLVVGGVAAPRAQGPSAERLPAASATVPGIGVLLPLSGRYQSFGESCLRGIRVALGAVQGRAPGVRMVILDSAGDPSQASTAYQRLASDAGIVAVLGPMISNEAEYVQPYAQGFGLATITFSQRPSPTGGPLFRFSFTREGQARTLARYAVHELGLRRLAIFRSDDLHGRDIALAFRSASERLGGRVIADVSYDPAKDDLQIEAKRLQAKISAIGGQPPSVDGIFLPVGAERLGLIASYLGFADIRGVQLLGDSGWDRPPALLAAGPSVNGGVFVDGFFLYSFRPEVRLFVDAYRDAYQNDPGTLEAYGYDAAMLLRELIASGADTRSGLLGGLYRSSVRRGATGETVVTGDGRIEKGLFLLKIEDGTIRELDTPAASAAAAVASGAPAAPAGQWRRPELDSRSVESGIGR